MKLKFIFPILCFGLLNVFSAKSQNIQTVSVGYAYSQVDSFTHLNGINLKYRYEFGSPYSIIGSLSYLSGQKGFSTSSATGYTRSNEQLKYYSLLVGPALRVNHYVSLFALLGFNTSRVSDYYESGSDNYYNHSDYAGNKTHLAYGFGAQINPMPNIAVDFACEGSKYADHNINGVNLGVGYRF
jgi:putative virulence related protein PagC